MLPLTTLIDAATLAKHAPDPGWAVFDCRFDLADTASGRESYRKAHIPGAVYAHIDEHLSSPITPLTGRHPLPDVARLKHWLGKCGVDGDTQVAVYDDTGGNMAARLWWLLRWLGHSAVAVLDGGWQAWQAGGLPQSGVPPARHATRFEGAPDWAQVLTTNDIIQDLETRHWLLIDARTALRFCGEQEPIDPVAGHIPGSVNFPLQLNLNEEGRFKSRDDLHARYTAVLNGRDPHRTACLCGSGVTACHNILAMEIAGLAGSRLYAGSWSEWIRDPARPVATGGAQRSLDAAGDG